MQLQNVIVMMGAPGSGKGTQTKLLASKLGFAFFSTGELSREYAQQDSDFGRKIKSIIDQGIILPIEIIREIFTKKFDTLINEPGVILDGYPRTLEQVDLLEDLIKKYDIKNLKVVFLDVDREKLAGRLALRAQKERRADDDALAVLKRFDEYMLKTAPVKEYYESKGSLVQIQGDQAENAEESIKKVHAEIMKKVS